jgi:hypothetical protein
VIIKWIKQVRVWLKIYAIIHFNIIIINEDVGLRWNIVDNMEHFVMHHKKHNIFFGIKASSGECKFAFSWCCLNCAKYIGLNIFYRVSRYRAISYVVHKRGTTINGGHFIYFIEIATKFKLSSTTFLLLEKKCLFPTSQDYFGIAKVIIFFF